MKINIVQQLKRRGYTVTETAGDGLLIEKPSFWGFMQYDTSINQNTSRFYWPRAILLGLISYGLILISAGLWYLHRKGVMEQEVLALTQGVK